MNEKYDVPDLNIKKKKRDRNMMMTVNLNLKNDRN